MPLASTDIEFRLSGGGGNSDPDASLGGAISSTEITDATLHNLFDVVGSSEASAGDTEYRCFYIINNYTGSPQITAENVTIHIQTATPSSDTNVAIGLGTEGVSATTETIANESTAPTSTSPIVAFTAITDSPNVLSVGNLAVGAYQAIWIRRTVSSSASAYTNDGPVIRVTFDSAG